MKIKTADKKEDGFVFVEAFVYGKQIWVWCRVRKWHVCPVCKERFESGAIMYRPLADRGNRAHRCCTGCMDTAAEIEK